MTVQLRLATSPVLHSHVWPVTTALDSAALDTAILKPRLPRETGPLAQRSFRRILRETDSTYSN